jgi:hypothetical protein
MVVEDGCVVGSFGFIAFWLVSCLLEHGYIVQTTIHIA